MQKAIIKDKYSKAYKKEVFVHGRKGSVYLCSFTEDGDRYHFWKGNLKFIESDSE